MRGLPKFHDENLIVGTEGFSDAAVYRLRDDLLIVQSLDFFPPLVDDPYLFGQIAAANSLSDIYAMGARPVTALNIVGFPDKELPLEILGDILRGGADKVAEAGAVIAGGHSVRDAEIKYGLSVTGVVTPQGLLTNQRAQPGDVLILTKALGTGFVTTAAKADRCPAELLDAATKSMATLNKAASEAATTHGAHAATDITGFGLAGHATEMAESSGVTIEIELSRLPVLPGVLVLIKAGGNRNRATASNREYTGAKTKTDSAADESLVDLAFDAQTSGGLLLSVPQDRAAALMEQALRSGAPIATMIGRVTERRECPLVLKV